MADQRAELTSRLYTARASAVGGRQGEIVTGDGELRLQLGKPGSGQGTNPEQLLAGAWAACLQSTLVGLAARSDLELGNTNVTAAVTLGQDSFGSWALEAELEVVRDDGPFVGFRELVEEAHAVCPFSRMAAGIPVTLVVR